MAPTQPQIGVLFPSGHLPTTGGERTMLAVAQGLRRRGLGIVALCRAGPLQAYLEGQGVAAVRLDPLEVAPYQATGFRMAAAAMAAGVRQGDLAAAMMAADRLMGLPFGPARGGLVGRLLDGGSIAPRRHTPSERAAMEGAYLFVQIRRLAERLGPALVVADLAGDAVAAVLATRFGRGLTGRVLWLVQEHGPHPADPFLAAHLDDIVAVSQSLRQARFAGASGAVTIVNGVDPVRWRPLPAGHQRPWELQPRAPAGLIVAQVGTLTASKNCLLLVHALAGSTTALPGAELFLFGRPNRFFLPTLCAAVRQENLAERVHLMGYWPDLDRMLPHVDIFCMPSRSEGLGLALAEAMACGVACVAADIPGLREVGGEDVLLVAPDDLEGWTGALATLASPGFRQELGRRGRRRVVESFSEARMLESVAELVADRSGSNPPQRLL